MKVSVASVENLYDEKERPSIWSNRMLGTSRLPKDNEITAGALKGHPNILNATESH
ncbi:MAG: hypothetical protein HOL92_11265 [Opitutales bacterium]|nr:hypothetical protein [Opitutales bacterium]